MTNEKKSGRGIIWCLVVAVIIMNLPAVYTLFYHQLTGAPEASRGKLDLSDVNLADGRIYLDGQWEFYWNQFIVSERLQTSNTEQTSKPDLTISVPDSWSNYQIDDKELSAAGYGSYRLTIENLIYDREIALYLPDFGGAYRIYIDGRLVADSGKPSKDRDEIFTVPKPDLYPLTLTSGRDHEVVIEVATTRFSGLYMTPVIDDYQTTIRSNNNRNTAELIMFGIAIFSFLALISMYTALIRRRILSFWLPVMLFSIILRIMLTSEFYSFWQPVFFFNVPYESTNELMYFTTFLLKYLLIFLVQEQCGIAFNRSEKVGFLIYYVILYFVYLFTPQSFYNVYLSVIVPMLTYVLEFYLVIKIYRGRQTMKRFGLVVFWGAMFVVIGLTIDSYYLNGKIYLDMSLTLLTCLTIFTLIMSWMYAMRLGDLYDDFAISSSRLEMANNQIEMQKEYYEALSGQMNEIREMKHDVRHFVGAASRLAEEGRLDDLRSFLNEYNEKTEMDQLPVFCENVIANSIIGYYYLRAKESGIQYESKCRIDYRVVMRDSDLCILLGNALENAIDACQKMKKTEIRMISMEAGSKNGQFLLKFRNTYRGKLSVRDGHYISSKAEKSHGLGIKNMEKVVESYGGFMKIEHDEKEFTLLAAIPEK